jgi:hypothetical protein
MANANIPKNSQLLMQKMVDGATVVNIYKQWNIVATEIPVPEIEAKDLPVHDFSGENGEDAYIPSYIPVKPYDIEIKFAYMGDLSQCYNNIYKGFLAYLQGTAPANEDYDSITEGGFKIYDQHNLIGRQKVYLKKFNGEGELVQDNEGEHLQFKMTFRVCDPVTDITLAEA